MIELCILVKKAGALMVIRKATKHDLDGIAAVYEAIHDEEEVGHAEIGWVRGVYPTRETAKASMERGDLFVLEEAGTILGAAIINQIQVDRYAGMPWAHAVPDDRVCVLHTLVIHPKVSGKGYGTAFVRFYEDYAMRSGWPELRLDTNARNRSARALYARLGYTEVGSAQTVFNGIPGVELVMLEKCIG